MTGSELKIVDHKSPGLMSSLPASPRELTSSISFFRGGHRLRPVEEHPEPCVAALLEDAAQPVRRDGLCLPRPGVTFALGEYPGHRTGDGEHVPLPLPPVRLPSGEEPLEDRPYVLAAHPHLPVL